MPKIPRYQQGQLASSVVGTPGIDNSTAKLFNEIGSQLNTVRNSMFQVAFEQRRQDLREQAQKERELKAVQKEQQRRVNKVELANHRFQMDSQLDELGNQLRQDHVNDPETVPDLLAKQGRDAISKYAESISNPDVRADFLSQSLNGLRSQTGGAASWAQRQGPINAEKNALSALDQFSIGLGNKQFPDEVLDGVAAFEEQYGQTYREQFGPKYDLMFQKAKEQGVKNYLSRLSRENPEQLDAVVNSGMFDDHIDQTSITSVYNTYKSYARQQEREIKKEQDYSDAVQWTQTLGDSDRGIITGETSLEDLDKLEEEAVASSAPKNVIKGIQSQKTRVVRESKKESKREEKERVMETRKTLGVEVAKTRTNLFKGSKLRSADPKALMDYKGLLIQANNAGAISATVFGKESAKVDLALQALDKRNKNSGFAQSLLDLMGSKKKSVRENVPDAKTAAVVFENAEAKFIFAVQRLEDTKGRKPSAEELERIWNAAYTRSLTDLSREQR